MFTFNGRDAHRSLPSARVHLPAKGTIVDILPDKAKTEEDQVRRGLCLFGLRLIYNRPTLRCFDYLPLG